RGETLPDCGHLGGNVVGPPGDGNRRVASGQVGHPNDRRHGPGQDHFEGASNLELFHVLGEIAGGHPEVDALVAGQMVELLQSRLHVVTQHSLAVGDRSQVHLIHHRPIGLHDLIGYVETEAALGFEHCYPQLTFEADPAGRVPDLFHLGGCVAGGEDVLDHAGTSIAAPRTPEESPWTFGTSRVATSPPNTYWPQRAGTRWYSSVTVLIPPPSTITSGPRMSITVASDRARRSQYRSRDPTAPPSPRRAASTTSGASRRVPFTRASSAANPGPETQVSMHPLFPQ